MSITQNKKMSTAENKNLWEEKNLIEPPMKSVNNGEFEECGIITDTNVLNENVPLNDIIVTKQKISGIYKIINKVNEKYYVGSSNNIYKRIKAHAYKLNQNINSCRYLQNAYNKYGINSFIWKIIELSIPNRRMEIEQKYLDIAKNEKEKCYNISFIVGRIEWNDENKQIRSILYKKEGNPNYKNGDKIKGKKNPFYGKHHTNESKEMQYLTKMKNGIINQDVFSFKNKTTDDTFIGNSRNFYHKYNLNRSNVMKLIQGKIRSVKNWILI